jgi:hypothetical protein
MNLNTIKIPELLLSELYRDTLVASGPVATRPPSTATTTSPSENIPAPKTAAPAIADPFIAPGYKAPESIAPGSLKETIPGSVQSISPAGNAQGTSPAGANVQETAPAAGYKYLGKNQKQITIIIHSPGIAFLPDDQLTVLTKMLEACRMNIGDVAIINHASLPVVINVLREQLHPAIILLFGIQPVDIRLPINFPAFKLQVYDDCTYLYAPSLADLVPPTEESKLLKSKLWVCLKDLFKI